MRILFLSAWFPHPATNGSQLRIAQLLRQLAPRHEVHLLSFSDAPATPDVPAAMTSLCRSLEIVPQPLFDPRRVRARLGFLSRRPRWLVDTHSPEMAARIAAAVAAPPGFDVIVASQTSMAAYAPWFGSVPALFEEVELAPWSGQFRHAPSLVTRVRFGLTWTKHRRYLASLLPRFRACTVVSEEERRLLTEAAPAYRPVEVIPNCVDLVSYADVRETPIPDTLIYTGSFRYLANHDAMQWFISEILPRVRAVRPGVELRITGDAGGRSVPPGAGVRHCGHVDDIRPLVAQSWISLAPIRVGGGTRMKILEAMALGTPVVATRKGAEGLGVTPGEHLLVADDAAAFADHLLRLLGDPALRRRLAAAGRALVADRYDWRRVGPDFEALVERVASGTVPGEEAVSC
jgi:glycosyltransferase involved in cell wall biosynthesis